MKLTSVSISFIDCSKSKVQVESFFEIWVYTPKGQADKGIRLSVKEFEQLKKAIKEENF